MCTPWKKKKKDYPTDGATEDETALLIPPSNGGGKGGGLSTIPEEKDPAYYYPDPDSDDDDLYHSTQPVQNNEPPYYDGRPLQPRGTDLLRKTAAAQEREIQGIRRQIRKTNEESLLSTDRALLKAEQAEESGRKVLTKLYKQHDQLTQAEKEIEVAKSQAEQSIEKTQDLKKLNSRPFFCCVCTSSDEAPEVAEKAADEKRVLQLEYAERRRRDVVEATRDEEEKWRRAKEKEKQRQPNDQDTESKYTFEGDKRDKEIEDGIARNLRDLEVATAHLKRLAILAGNELDADKPNTENITEKVFVSLLLRLTSRAAECENKLDLILDN